MKTRLRFGIQLSWPISNAAIFVAYVPQDVAEKAIGAVGTLRLLLAPYFGTVLDRLVCEAS